MVADTTILVQRKEPSDDSTSGDSDDDDDDVYAEPVRSPSRVSTSKAALQPSKSLAKSRKKAEHKRLAKLAQEDSDDGNQTEDEPVPKKKARQSKKLADDGS